jgi:hypothetical protein
MEYQRLSALFRDEWASMSPASDDGPGGGDPLGPERPGEQGRRRTLRLLSAACNKDRRLPIRIADAAFALDGRLMRVAARILSRHTPPGSFGSREGAPF